MLDKIKRIKYNRMKPEERYVYDIFTNLVEYHYKDDINDVYYKHNNVIMFNFKLNSGDFWCDHYNFWSFLQHEYHLNYEQISILVKGMVEEHLIKKDIKPFANEYIISVGKDEHLIKKDVTPIGGSEISSEGMEEHLIKKDVTPISLQNGFISSVMVEEHLIKKDVTPTRRYSLNIFQVEEHLIEKDVKLQINKGVIAEPFENIIKNKL
jgi:hypothetical protein